MKSVFNQKANLIPKIGDTFTVRLLSDRDLTLSPIPDLFGEKTKVPELIVALHFSDMWDQLYSGMATITEIDIDTALDIVWVTFEWNTRSTISLASVVPAQYLLQSPGEFFLDRRVNLTTVLNVNDVFALDPGDATGNPDGIFEKVQEATGGLFDFLKISGFVSVIILLVVLGVSLKTGLLAKLTGIPNLKI